MNKNPQIRYLSAINAPWFLIMFVLSLRMPLWGDDFFWRDQLSSPAAFEGARWMWWNLNGRFFGNFVWQIMKDVSPVVYATCNALVYVFMINALYWYIKAIVGINDEQGGIWCLFWIYIAGWFCTPDFAELLTWRSGSTGYLWTNCAILWFGLFYYHRFLAKKEDKDCNSGGFVKEIISCAALLIFGMIAGWSIEPSSCILMAALFLYAVWCVRNRKKIYTHEWFGAAGAVTGWALLIFAPGNRVKAQYAASARADNILYEMVYRFVRAFYYGFRELMIPVAVFVFLYMITRGVTESGRSGKTARIWDEWRRGEEVFFFSLAVLSLLIMVFSAGHSIRTLQFPFLMVLICAGCCFCRLLQHIRAANSVMYSTLQRALLVAGTLCILLAAVEAATGIMASGEGQFFDRTMRYVSGQGIGNQGITGVIPGDGLGGLK